MRLISLHGINGLGFITETGRVHCAVRTAGLDLIRENLFLKGSFEKYLELGLCRGLF